MEQQHGRTATEPALWPSPRRPSLQTAVSWFYTRDSCALRSLRQEQQDLLLSRPCFTSKK